MRTQEINVCRRDQVSGKLIILDVRECRILFDDDTNELTANYLGKWYLIQGNVFSPYILIR